MMASVENLLIGITDPMESTETTSTDQNISVDNVDSNNRTDRTNRVQLVTNQNLQTFSSNVARQIMPTDVQTNVQTNTQTNSKDCIGCANKIIDTVKINLQCRHEFCDKCVDKIIFKNTGELKCIICEPYDIESGIQIRNTSTICKYCTECINIHYTSFNNFLRIYCCDCKCINVQFIDNIIIMFLSLVSLLTIASIPLGITMLLKYGHYYSDTVNTFIISSIVGNGLYVILILRLGSVLGEIENEDKIGVSMFCFLLLIIHVLLFSFGFYVSGNSSDHNEVIMTFIMVNCLNIFIMFTTMFAIRR